MSVVVYDPRARYLTGLLGWPSYDARRQYLTGYDPRQRYLTGIRPVRKRRGDRFSALGDAYGEGSDTNTFVQDTSTTSLPVSDGNIVPGTGQTVAELKAIGYSDSDIAALYAQGSTRSTGTLQNKLNAPSPFAGIPNGMLLLGLGAIGLIAGSGGRRR